MVRHAALVALVVALAPSAGLALTPDEEAAEADIARVCTPKAPDYRPSTACGQSRFRAFEPNYATYQWTDDDESALRAHYSFRYQIFTTDCITPYRASYGRPDAERKAAADEMRRCFEEYDRHREWYLTYTGEFDFYVGTRPSGPVVNRISNPGFHFRQYLEPGPGWRQAVKWLDFAVEHKSDGQTTDPRRTELTPSGRVLAAQVADRNGDHAYLDTISVDTNYVSLEAYAEPAGPVRFYARAKLFYFANKVDVTWGPMADKGIDMADYDRFRFIVDYRLSDARPQNRREEEKRLSVEWTVGDKALRTDSLNLGLYWPVPVRGFLVPLFLRAHLGPLNTLANFTKEQNSVGIGLLFLD